MAEEKKEEGAEKEEDAEKKSPAKKGDPEKSEGVTRERTEKDFLNNIFDPEDEKRAREWLAQQQARAAQWENADKGRDPDLSCVEGIQQEDPYQQEAFESMIGQNIEMLPSYSRVKELTEGKEGAGVQPMYVRLLMAHETMVRLRDGRIVLAGMHPTRGPILAAAGPPELRERELKLRKY